jgi:GcrA cell cycle regulator
MDHKSPEPDYYYKGQARIWTKSGIAKILDGVRARKSMGMIAEELGIPLRQRGIISGLISRARLRGELPPATRQQPRLSVTKAFRPPPSAPPCAPLQPVVINRSVPEKSKVRLKVVESPLMVTLFELKSHQCKFPIGDPRLSDFRYCGAHRIEGEALLFGSL